MKRQQTKTAVLTLMVKIGVYMQSFLSRMPEISIHRDCCLTLLSETENKHITRSKVAQ